MTTKAQSLQALAHLQDESLLENGKHDLPRIQHLASGLALSTQSMYVRLTRISEEQGISRSEALKRLEDQYLPAGTCQ